MLGVNSVSITPTEMIPDIGRFFFPLVNVFTSMFVDRMEVLEYRKKNLSYFFRSPNKKKSLRQKKYFVKKKLYDKKNFLAIRKNF